jgi:L-threonylcarbamoyladenylate synthase
MRQVTLEDERLPLQLRQEIRGLLKRGELLVYPTDTLYALGGLATCAAAAQRVRSAKGREHGKALSVVAANREQIQDLCPEWGDAAQELAEAFWPGPLTLVVSAGSGWPREVTAGTGSIALRVPAAELTRQLCRLAGPLIATSANRSGEPPATNSSEAADAFSDAVSMVIDSGVPAQGLPSTIVDVTGARARLLREGVIPWTAVRARLGLDAAAEDDVAEVGTESN